MARVTLKSVKDVDHAKVWERCIDEARRILKAEKNKTKQAIVALANEACDIFHGGGGHWTGFADVYTVKRFAEEVDMNYKTLIGWIEIKKRVADFLPAELQPDFDYGIGFTVSRLLATMPKPVKAAHITKAYLDLKMMPKELKVDILIDKYYSTLRSTVNRCNQKQLRYLLGHLRGLCDEIEEGLDTKPPKRPKG